MSMLSVAAVGVGAVLLTAQLKGVRGEYALYLSLTAGLLFAFFSLQKLDTIIQTVREIQSALSFSGIYFTTLLKLIGIAWLGEFAAGICRDSGQSFLGSQIEIFGKLSILGISAPVILALMQTLDSFVKS